MKTMRLLIFVILILLMLNLSVFSDFRQSTDNAENPVYLLPRWQS